MRSTCRRCGGKGTVISTPCQSCRGTGQTKQKKTVMVPVPAGQLNYLFGKVFLLSKDLKYDFLFNIVKHEVY